MSHSDFYDALSRLIANEPIRINKGYKINKDTVAREAGRKRGAIKASRASHTELIKSIDAASNNADADKQSGARLLATTRAKCKEYRDLYRESLARELMYSHRLAELETGLRAKSKIVPIRKDY